MGSVRIGNPFTPSFGVSPPLLVGREHELADFQGALDASIGDPFRAVRVTGLRGSGKTVFLNHVEDLARERGWAVISESAQQGLVERLTRTVLPGLLAANDPAAQASTVTGGNAGVLGVSAGLQREVTHRYAVQEDLRTLLSRLTDVMKQRGAGVLLTVDEMNRKATEDLQVITQAVQHCFREGRELAFVGAGLPLEVHALLDEPGTTFLRRAEVFTLGVISESDVRLGLLEPLRTWGRDITSDAADVAVAGAKGYPFLLQAIGHRLWATSTEEIPIDRTVALAAVEYATRRVGDLVTTPELRGLSPIDRSYLAAMAIDSGPSRTRDIADRLGVSPQYANTYRARLIEAGLITEAGHGTVDLVLPTLRDYLREHTATEPLGPPDLPSGADRTVLPDSTHLRRALGPQLGPGGGGRGVSW